MIAGHIFGEQVIGLLTWLGRRRALLLIVPAGMLAILAYRLWRRWRYGAARPLISAGLTSPREDRVPP